MQPPAGQLDGTSEFPPTRVVLHADLQLGTGGVINSPGEVPLGGITPIPLPWHGGAHSRLDNNGIVSRTCRYHNPGSDPNGTGKLDRIMHGHLEPC